MILILAENTDPNSAEYQQLLASLAALPDISPRVHRIEGAERAVIEIYLIGNTKALQVDDVNSLPCV